MTTMMIIMMTIIAFLVLVQTEAQLPSYDDIPRLFPQPHSISTNFTGNASSLELSSSFTFTTKTNSDILQFNTDYYQKLIFQRNTSKTTSTTTTTPTLPIINHLNIKVIEQVTSASYPHLNADESYNLDVQSPISTLTAPTIWGALHGLETFSQLIQMNRKLVIRGGGPQFTIQDKPRFTYRGLMLDPARHFITIKDINRTIDAMSQNKLNTLHIHFTDGESFTINTEKWLKYTNLSIKGAYSPRLSYTADDLKAIVAHGRMKGVRIIPEFDLPAHMASWAQGVPELITDCPSVNPHPEWPRYYSPADVTNELLYDVLDELLSQLNTIFVDEFFHVGGDEPHFPCWDASESVSKYKKKQNMTNIQLYNYFENRYNVLLQKYNKTRQGWEEVFTLSTSNNKNENSFDSSTIVHVWKGNDELANVVAAGLRGIVSSNWYLNNGGDWTKYYSDDPLSYLPNNSTLQMKKLVQGGSACMWASAFSMSSNMESTIWPNAAAMAEQLWSGTVENVNKVRTRLSQHRCRMIRRGISASPIAEDYCDDNLYVRKSNSFSYPGDFPWSPETPGP